jgi:hypothetical protein
MEESSIAKLLGHATVQFGTGTNQEEANFGIVDQKRALG